MKMSFTSGEDEQYNFIAEIPEGSTIHDVLEAITGLLLTTSFNYVSIMNAYIDESERMLQAIKGYAKAKIVYQET